jgi:hypothetical protein
VFIVIQKPNSNKVFLSKEPVVSVIVTHCKYGRSSIGISVYMYK